MPVKQPVEIAGLRALRGVWGGGVALGSISLKEVKSHGN
jgi:hypothetical protein